MRILPRVICMAFCVITVKVAQAQYVDYTLYQTENVNQFRVINDTLRCIANPADSAYGYLPCLALGSIWMNFSQKDVERMYGKVFKTEEDHNGFRTPIYILPSDHPKEMPYLAVMMTGDKIMGLEMTGTDTSKDVLFSSLKLGDKEKKIISVLGKPTKISPEDEYMHWDYTPFPFYLLIEDGKLHSVTVMNDGGGVAETTDK